MMLEKLSNKVNPKKNICKPSWKLEIKFGSMGKVGRRKGIMGS